MPGIPGGLPPAAGDQVKTPILPSRRPILACRYPGYAESPDPPGPL